MDRNIFISSLPCIIPIESTKWPPVVPNCNNAKDDKKFQMFFQDQSYVLSIENNNNENNQQVLFFSCTNNDKNNDVNDPALTSIQLAIIHEETTTLTDNNNINNNNYYVYILLGNTNVYLLDMRLVKTIQKTVFSNKEGLIDNNETTLKNNNKKPPSLLIIFDYIQFRIFTQNNNYLDNGKDTLLESLYQLLTSSELGQLKIVSSSYTSPFIEKRRQSSGSSSSKTMSDNTTTTPSPQSVRKRQLDECYARFQRRCIATTECQQNLSKLQHILTLPVVPYYYSNQNNGTDKETTARQLKGLLNNIAKQQSLSYISNIDYDTINEQLCMEIGQETDELEEILTNFFPAPRQRHQRIMSVGKEEKITTTIKPKKEASEQTFRQLMKKRKKSIEKRHELLLLPKRL